jgi:hypothetical protein
MTMNLTYSKFKENNELSIELNLLFDNNDLFLQNIYSYEDYGMQLEVDMIYPIMLHDYHNELPLAPDYIKINNSVKLIASFDNKCNYSIHIKLLYLYLNLG